MRKAVIVDDDPITRMDLTDILTRAGFAVAGQGVDGFDAIELCRTHSPELVLMDIRMPVFDGLDATKTVVRENLAGCVVILSAFNDADFIARAKDFGVAGYVVKPADERTLLPAIEIALAQSGRYRAVREENRNMRRRLDDKNIVDRAKAILAAKNGTGESEAYAALRKTAMNRSLSIADIARSVVDAADDREDVDRAKKLLMEKAGLCESAAFRRVKARAERGRTSLRRAARDIAAEFGA